MEKARTGDGQKEHTGFGYRRYSMDARRAFCVLFRKTPWLVLAALLGAGIGVTLYLIAEHIAYPSPLYTSVTELYIDFAFNENTQTTYNYYNAYTWNDIVETDEILGKALEALDGEYPTEAYTREELKEAVVTELPSDIRLIHMTVTTTSAERTERIRCAMRDAILAFGENMREFERIRVISEEAPHVLLPVSKAVRAAEAGGVIGFLLGMFFLCLWYALDDRILTPSDLIGHVSCPFAGILPVKSPVPAGVEGMTFVRASDVSESTAGNVCLGLPFGKMSVACLEVLLERLRLQGATVGAVCIYDADERFLRRYDKRLLYGTDKEG